MSLKRVQQEHVNGCFVGALATLTGQTYKKTFVKLFGKWDAGYFSGIAPMTNLREYLDKLGLKHRVSSSKRFHTLSKDALVVVTWIGNPELAHTIVWDSKARKVLDPYYSRPRLVRDYQGGNAEVTLVFEITGRARKLARRSNRSQSESASAKSSRQPGSRPSRQGRR